MPVKQHEMEFQKRSRGGSCDFAARQAGARRNQGSMGHRPKRGLRRQILDGLGALPMTLPWDVADFRPAGDD
jgi:hypothetical protein